MSYSDSNRYGNDLHNLLIISMMTKSNYSDKLKSFRLISMRNNISKNHTISTHYLNKTKNENYINE